MKPWTDEVCAVCGAPPAGVLPGQDGHLGEGRKVVCAEHYRKGEATMASKKKMNGDSPAVDPSSATDERPVLSWPAAKFRAALRAALVAAATDVERQHMAAVHLQRRNGVLTVSSTDGHLLFRWTEPEGQTDEHGDVVNRRPFQCLIPRRTLESFLGVTKKHLELERVLLSGADQRWQLETIIDVCRHEFLQVPTPFPSVDNFIPKVVAPTCSGIGVGANLLTRVAKAFALATGEPETTVFWQFTGDAKSPLVCTSPSHEELLAVVAPRDLKADAHAVPEDPEPREARDAVVFDAASKARLT